MLFCELKLSSPFYLKKYYSPFYIIFFILSCGTQNEKMFIFLDNVFLIIVFLVWINLFIVI